jgi:hypothetical protein
VLPRPAVTRGSPRVRRKSGRAFREGLLGHEEPAASELRFRLPAPTFRTLPRKPRRGLITRSWIPVRVRCFPSVPTASHLIPGSSPPSDGSAKRKPLLLNDGVTPLVLGRKQSDRRGRQRRPKFSVVGFTRRRSGNRPVRRRASRLHRWRVRPAEHAA